jgi:hypothetical protein
MQEFDLPGSGLVELYIRLRNQMESGERDLDPNRKSRASIAMAILVAEEKLGANIAEIEAQVRESLGLALPTQVAA